jgi:Family of unknown function (DUF5681)
MADKSETENPGPQLTADAGPFVPEGRVGSSLDLNPNGDPERTDKGDRQNRSIATRFQKGKSGNPKGRPKKVTPDPDTSPGDILQAIDNEEAVIVIGGKRWYVTTAEVHFLQLFDKSGRGDLEAAKLIKDMAVKYFGPEAEGPSETRFLVVPDEDLEPKANKKTSALPESGELKNDRPRASRRRPTAIQQSFAVGYLFRKVANQEVVVDVYGTRTKMTRWDAYVRRIYMMALEGNTKAAKLLDQLRKQFPGKALPGDPITFLIREEDARL